MLLLLGEWTISFLKNHPDEIKQPTWQNIKTDHANLNLEPLVDCFGNLKQTTHDVLASNLLNYNETNVLEKVATK